MALQNDWIVASLNNPHLDAYELSTLGDLDTLNTLFLSREDYLKSNYIRNNDNFKDENGNFSESKFNDFYNQQAERFGQLQRDEFPKGLALDPFDTRRRPGSNIRKNQFDIGSAYDPAKGKFGNPDKVKIGVEAWDVTSERTKSEAEIALMQKIYDTATGKYKDETPLDSALFENPFKFFKNIFDDPLVLATYDKDEEDEYGIKHKKGEKKLNDEGTYYYETLNGRSPLGKQVLSLSDILTKEDSVLNHIDFMDSDDLDKSIPGIIAKNVAMIAPMFTPASGLYMGAMIGKEMVRALPMMYEVATNLLGPDSVSTPKWMNNLAARGESLTSGNSVYASEHTFSFENLANMISDIALLWGQQKQIAKTVNMMGDKKALQDAEKRAYELYKNKSTGRLAGMAQISPEASVMGLMSGLTEDQLWKTTTLGQMCLQKTLKPVLDAMAMKAQYGKDLALAYMAIVSNTDVYSDMLEKGATKKEAAWVTLGSTLGMFSVDKYTGIGEMFFDDERAALMSEARKALRKEIDDAASSIYQSTTKNTPKGLFNKGLALGKKLGDQLGDYFYRVKNHDLGMIGKAIGEGLEEVSEEAVSDVSRGLYSLLGDLGLYDKSIKGSVIDYDTALERYGMSFLGGTLGGGLFYGVEKFLNRFDKRRDRDIVELTKDGRANELREAMILLKRDGRVGSTTLSGLDYVKNEGSDLVTWLSTDEKERSQNDLIANRVIDKINSIEATIVGNNLNLNDDLLFENMVLSEARYQQFKNASYATGYYGEFNKKLSNLVAAEQALKEASTTTDGNPGTDTKVTDTTLKDPAAKAIREQNLAKLQESVEKAKKEVDEFLSGDTALQYTRKLNFLLDPVLNLVFLDLDFEKWAKKKGYDDTTDLLKLIDIQKEWYEYVSDTMKSDKVDKGFAAFEILEKSLLAPTMEQAEVGKNYKLALDALQALYKLNEDETDYELSVEEYFKKNKQYTLNSRLVDENGVEEDEETYKNRGLRETPDLKIAFAKRTLRVFELNRQLLLNYVNLFELILAPLNYKIDAATGRHLVQTVRGRIKDQIMSEAEYGVYDSLTSLLFDINKYKDLLSELNDDLSNRDDVEKMLQERLKLNVTAAASAVVLNLSKFDGFKQIAVDRTPLQMANDITELSKIFSFGNKGSNSQIEQVISNLTDDEVSGLINDINSLNNDENYFIKDYLSKNKLENIEDYRKFSDYSGIFGYVPLINSVKELVINGNLDGAKGVLNSLIGLEKVKQFLDSNPNPTLEQIQFLCLELESDFDEQVKLTLPLNLLHDRQTLPDVLRKFSTEFKEFRINDVIRDLENPESAESKFFAKYSISSELLTVIHDYLLNLTPESIPFGKDTMIGILSDPTQDPEFDKYYLTSQTIKRQSASVTRYLDNTINRVKSNPIVQLYNKLLVTLSSPLEKILLAVATKISDDSTVNVNQILDNAYKSYLSADTPYTFELEPELMNQMNVAEQALKMASAFIYSASTRATGDSYFGQNHQINEFAENHKDALIKQWNPLPEIDEEYAALLNSETSKLYKELQVWKMLSDFTTINKIGRLSKISSISYDMRYKALKGMSLKFSVGDKEYDLKEGVELSSTLPDSNSDKLKGLFEAEQTIYENFLKVLKETEKTPDEIFEIMFDLNQSGMNLTFSSDEMKKLMVRSIDSTTSSDDMLSYDKALYLLTVLSDNPSSYYRSVISSIKKNEGIAPLTVQLNISRLAEVAHTKIYKAGFKQLAKKFNKYVTVTPNVVHIDGVAGAGKTEVVLKDVRQRYSDEEVICVGPTASQSIKLAKSLNEVTSYTFDPSDKNNIFKLLLGTQQWNTLNSELERLGREVDKLNTDKDYQEKVDSGEPVEVAFDCDYFRLIKFNDGDPKGLYGVRVELKLDKIEFLPELDQKLIFVDEAAHMNPLQIALLDAYAEKVGGTVYLASDSAQSGYNQYGLENLGPTSIFATRSGKLKESLRTANILMLENAKKLEAYLDFFEHTFNYGSESEQKDLENRAGDFFKKLKLRVYNGDDDINGWLFGADIHKTIETLKKVVASRKPTDKKLTIGFIGDKDSEIYQLLKNSGLEVSEPLTATRKPGLKFMQGLEFDYVIIDHLDNIPQSIKEYRDINGFVKNFNTIATRGKTASIFMDKEPLEKLFGKNQVDSYKSMGFDISKSVGKAKEDFMTALSQLKLREEVKEEPEKEKKKKEASKTEVESEIPTGVEEESGEIRVDIPDVDVPEYDPKVNDRQLKKLENEIQSEILAEDELLDNEVVVDERTGESVIEANTVFPLLSLELEDIPGKKYKKWLPFDTSSKPTVRRNLQVFLTTETEPDGVVKLSDKEKYQGYLRSILSYVLFGNKKPNVPINFDWTKMKLQLLVRKRTDTDVFGIKSDLENTFIEINGERYVISIVATVPSETRSGGDKFDAMFDIALLSDPNLLDTKKRLKKITDNLNALIEKWENALKDRDKLNESQIKAFETLILNAKNLITNLPSVADSYKKGIYEMIEKRPDGFTLDLDTEDYFSHKTTRVVNRGDRPARRLGTHVNPGNIENNVRGEDGEYLTDTNSFNDLDGKVDSDIYILGTLAGKLRNSVHESVFGRAVIFTSSNTNLSKDDLAKMYLDLKTNPNAHTPEVRMIPLNNYGLSFSEIVYGRIQKVLAGETGKHSGSPWRMDVLGIKMFTAIWNFRAALHNFNHVYQDWITEKGYTHLKVEDLLKAEAEFYNTKVKTLGYNSTVEAELNKGVLFSYKTHNGTITLDDLKELIKFNYEICKDIPIFRLGLDLTTNVGTSHLGGYIRPFRIHKDSTVYDDDAKRNLINLFAIQADSANRLAKILDVILGLITTIPEEWAADDWGGDPPKSLLTRITHKDGSKIEADEYIGKSKTERNLSGMIHTKNKQIKLGELDAEGNIQESLGIGPESIFSFFPKMITSVVAASKTAQGNADKRGLIRIKTIKPDDTEDSYNFDLGLLFDDGLLTNDPNDNLLLNLFNVIFHGTTESLEKWRLPRKGNLKRSYLYDAPFKYGFFVDPDLEYNDNIEPSELNIGPEGEGSNYVLLKCSNSPAYFTVNVDVIPGGLGLFWDKIYDKFNLMIKGENKEKGPINGPELKKFSDTIEDPIIKNDFLSYLMNDENLEDNEETYNEFILYNRGLILSSLNNNTIGDEDNISNVINMINELLPNLVEYSTIQIKEFREEDISGKYFVSEDGIVYKISWDDVEERLNLEKIGEDLENKGKGGGQANVLSEEASNIQSKLEEFIRQNEDKFEGNENFNNIKDIYSLLIACNGDEIKFNDVLKSKNPSTGKINGLSVAIGLNQLGQRTLGRLVKNYTNNC